MQTAMQPLMPPLHAQLAHRPQYPHPSINSSVTRTASGLLAMPSQPVASSSTARKRKRPQQHQYSVSYSEVHEVDHEGRLREVIIIEDTPPPPSTLSPALTASTTTNGGYSMSHQPPIFNAPIRTRARAAAEAQLVSSASSSVMAAPAPKKRKRDPDGGSLLASSKKVQTNKYPNGSNAIPPLTTKSWASGSGAATDDVRSLFVVHITKLNQLDIKGTTIMR